MDLSRLMNDSGPAASAQAKSQQQAPPAMPSTPVQPAPPPSFRDYSQTTQASPGRHVAQEYGAQPMPAGPYASPSPYQASAQLPYGARPAPLQQLPPNDPRSPSMSAGPVPSPYRPTPTSSVSAATAGYPFPPQAQTPTSPAQRHQYPTSGAYPRDPRESFAAPSGPVVMTGPPGAPPYMQGAPMPQTPPIGTPGGAHPYLHQRSQSTHSTPTPTSAQSQQPQYGTHYVGSPVATAHPPPQLDHHARQLSQPPTPIGPPMPVTRQSSGPSFAHPSSPYQQRLSIGSYQHPVVQASPPPPPSAIPRPPSNHAYHDPVTHDYSRRSTSHSERDRSSSVSPKTRVPSLPSSTGRPSLAESDPRLIQPPHLDSERERAVTPAKRKLEDRDLGPEELERRETRPPPFEAGVNGNNHSVGSVSYQHVRSSTSPVTERKRRSRFHAVRPVWAQLFQRDTKLNKPNYVVFKPTNNHLGNLNGKQEGKVKQEEMSRHASPEERRSMPNSQAASTTAPPVTNQPPQEPNSGNPLGPWEPTILGTRPHEEMSKNLADWLFCNVVQNQDMGEIRSRGVDFEIEAKLGYLIDKDTNHRVHLPVVTECVLHDEGRLAFRSSMTQAYHKQFNEFLNTSLQNTLRHNMENPQSPRLQMKYNHRYEVDRFFELPHFVREQLPACVQNRIPPKHTAKVRVTYDQKTNEVRNQIIKARVADINLHFPSCPLDCRISVNLEMHWDGSIQELEKFTAESGREPLSDRVKDRLSYGHGPYQVDLTQVKHTVPGPNHTRVEELEHELEIEVNWREVIEQGQRAAGGQSHQYPDLVEGLLDNVRLLSRKAREFGA